VRLLQLFGSYLTDVPVSPAQTFQFMHLECGKYLLVAVGAKQRVSTWDHATNDRYSPRRP